MVDTQGQENVNRPTQRHVHVVWLVCCLHLVLPPSSAAGPEVWEAEENEKAKKKRQEELRVQYLKEQEMQNNKYIVHFDVCCVTIM